MGGDVDLRLQGELGEEPLDVAVAILEDVDVLGIDLGEDSQGDVFSLLVGQVLEGLLYPLGGGFFLAGHDVGVIDYLFAKREGDRVGSRLLDWLSADG